MCSFSDFVSDNSSFLLTMFGMMAAACSGCLVFILRSRCNMISCCGMRIERIPLSEEAMNTANIL